MFAHLKMYDVSANHQANMSLWQAFQDFQPHASKLSSAGDNLMADRSSPVLVFVKDLCPAIPSKVGWPGAAGSDHQQ